MFSEPWDYSSPLFPIIKMKKIMIFVLFCFTLQSWAIVIRKGLGFLGFFFFGSWNYSYVIPTFSSGLQNCRFVGFYYNSGFWMFAIFIPFSPSQWRQYCVVKNSWTLMQDKLSFENWFYSVLAWIPYLPLWKIRKSTLPFQNYSDKRNTLKII